QDDPRPGLDYDQRHLHRAAVPGRAADLRHRPHHVLGRLSLCAERGRPPLPRPHRLAAGRYGQALPRQCRRAAEDQGVSVVSTNKVEPLAGWRRLTGGLLCSGGTAMSSTTASPADTHAYARFTRRVRAVMIDSIVFMLILAITLIVATSLGSDNI